MATPQTVEEMAQMDPRNIITGPDPTATVDSGGDIFASESKQQGVKISSAPKNNAIWVGILIIFVVILVTVIVYLIMNHSKQTAIVAANATIHAQARQLQQYDSALRANTEAYNKLQADYVSASERAKINDTGAVVDLGRKTHRGGVEPKVEDPVTDSPGGTVGNPNPQTVTPPVQAAEPADGIQGIFPGRPGK